MNTYLKHIFIITVGIFLISATTPAVSADDSKAYDKAIVIKVIDGDSLEVSQNGTVNSIRLYGIDAPEWKQPYSRKARSYLEKLLSGKEILYEELYTDRFGRSVALVYYQGNCINQLLIEKGLAWVHIYFCHKDICEYWKKLERIAKKENRGLWKEKNPVPPWIWKRNKN